jgi:predicted ribosome-associated RNA-binding protein Tma20
LRAGLRAIYGYGQGFQDMYLIDHGISENILSGKNFIIKLIIQTNGSFSKETNLLIFLEKQKRTISFDHT